MTGYSHPAPAAPVPARGRAEETNDPLHHAKRPRAALAGPYGHPFHPILVTVPIGAWVASLVFDIVALASADGSAFATGATLLVAIGVIGALVAAVFGLLDLSVIKPGTTARSTALTHMTINLGVTALFIAGFLVRVVPGADEPSVAGLVLSVVGLAALGVSGWLGGKLAYRYGVRVADEGTQTEGFR